MINPELVEKFASGEGVFFVGAGLSIGGGLRSWDELMRPLREDLRAVRTIAGRPTDDLDYLSYLGLAQAYEAEVNRMRLIEQLRSSLPRLDGGPTDVHAALFKFPIQEIYTTNFDKFLEDAAVKHRWNYHTVIRPSDADDTPKSSTNGAPSVRIVKIHGDYDDKESIVITEEDYRLARERKGKIWADMDQMFRTKTVLFLGYSFNDPDLQHLINDVRERAGRFPRGAYSVLLDDAPGEKERLRSIGIQAIPLQRSRKLTINEALAEWLNKFAEKVAQHSRPTSASEPVPHNLPPRRPLIGREVELHALISMLDWGENCIPLCGAPGVGKTNIALAAAYQCAGVGRPFKYVVWVSARDRGSDAEQTYESPPKKLVTDLLTAVERTTGYSIGVSCAEVPLSEVFSTEIAEQMTSLLNISKDGYDDVDASDAQKKWIMSSEQRERLSYISRHHPLLIILDHLEPDQKIGFDEILESDLGSSCILVTSEGENFDGGAMLSGLSSSDAIKFLTSLIRTGSGKHPLVYADDRQLIEFSEAFHGNPLLINLGFHLVEKGYDLKKLIRLMLRVGERDSLKNIQEIIWSGLGKNSKKLLFAASKFATLGLDEKVLRSVIQMDLRTFSDTIEECLSYGLMEKEKGDGRVAARVRLHPTTIQFVRSRSEEEDSEVFSVQKQIVEYYLDFVHRCVVRRRPGRRYWNALVSDCMDDLDGEWANIRLSAKISLLKDPNCYIEFPMLLLHYMDSRLYNRDRLRAARHAINLLVLHEDWEGAALMYLDALAWTHMEQYRLEEASQAVGDGLKHAAKLEKESRARVDLDTLGTAWLSRIVLERGKNPEARRLIAEALGRPVSPWIRVRVLMVAGDVELREGNGQEALDYYKGALQLAAHEYGSEGNGYELLPRIGLAYISINDLKGARDTFGELAKPSEIPVARLYGKYGLGLADHLERNTAEVRKRVEDAAFELKDRKSRMLLLKAFEQQYELQREYHRRRLQDWWDLGTPWASRTDSPGSGPAGPPPTPAKLPGGHWSELQ